MEAHLASMQPTQVTKITSSCDIYSGPHNTQYCMEDPEQAFVEYVSPRTDEAGGDDGYVMFIEIVKKNDDAREEEPKAGGLEVEYFDIFLTRRNLTYVTDFMIVENNYSIIDPRLSQVVLGKPFVDISNMTHDPPKGVVIFDEKKLGSS
ncbi:hypothetical protein Tco_0766216 [Tanacetum coccineum]